jgi:hypothetical protein
MGYLGLGRFIRRLVATLQAFSARVFARVKEMATKIPWATDANHPAGGNPWSGQPNKVIPSLGRWQQGWPPQLKLPSEHLNYLINLFGDWIDRVHSLQLHNWLKSTDNITALTWGQGAAGVEGGAVVGGNGWFSAIDHDGFTILTRDMRLPLAPNLLGPLYWEDEVNDPASVGGWVAGAPGVLVDMAIDPSASAFGAGGPRMAVSASAAAQVIYSPTRNAWSITTPITGGVLWGVVAHGLGLTNDWVIGGNGGEIETSPDAVAWTVRASGLAASPILCMEHNKEAGGTSRYVAMTATEVTTSPDGITWTAAAHGLTSPPVALAYTGPGLGHQRWVAILQNGTDIAWSDDQGATWTQGVGALTLWSTSGTLLKVSVASDGEGSLVATAKDTGSEEMAWASKDNGMSWQHIFYDDAAGSNKNLGAGVAYDSGAFVMVGADVRRYSLQLSE